MDNPYTPPSAKVEEMETTPGSPVKGVIYGVLVDLGGTIITGIALGMIYAVNLMSSGVSEKEMAAQLAQMPEASWLYVSSAIIGCLCSVLGGYVCARTARRVEYKAGTVMAAISIAFGLLMGSAHSVPVYLLLAVATWASVMAGVWLALRRTRVPVPALAA